MTSRRPRSSTSSTRVNPRPSLLVIAGPSGAGKTSVATGLVQRDPDLVLSVSVTTRPARHGERDGEAYRFVGDDEFDRLIIAGAFLEWAEVHGHRYGTPRDQVERAMADGRTVVLEIDVQGARQVRAAMPEAVTVFIEPPNMDVLRERLSGRRTETPEALQRRLATAEEEMREAPAFHHRVVNDRLEAAVEAVARILGGTSREQQELT